VLFVLGHETAHALVSEMGTTGFLGGKRTRPIALATIVALKMGDSFADRVVVNAEGLVSQRSARSERGHSE